MSKTTNNNKKYNAFVIELLIKKYGVSKRFITMSLNGDRKSETSDSIIKEYKRLDKEYTEAISTIE